MGPEIPDSYPSVKCLTPILSCTYYLLQKRERRNIESWCFFWKDTKIGNLMLAIGGPGSVVLARAFAMFGVFAPGILYMGFFFGCERLLLWDEDALACSVDWCAAGICDMLSSYGVKFDCKSTVLSVSGDHIYHLQHQHQLAHTEPTCPTPHSPPSIEFQFPSSDPGVPAAANWLIIYILGSGICSAGDSTWSVYTWLDGSYQFPSCLLFLPSFASISKVGCRIPVCLLWIPMFCPSLFGEICWMICSESGYSSVLHYDISFFCFFPVYV